MSIRLNRRDATGLLAAGIVGVATSTSSDSAAPTFPFPASAISGPRVEVGNARAFTAAIARLRVAGGGTIRLTSGTHDFSHYRAQDFDFPVRIEAAEPGRCTVETGIAHGGDVDDTHGSHVFAYLGGGRHRFELAGITFVGWKCVLVPTRGEPSGPGAEGVIWNREVTTYPFTGGVIVDGCRFFRCRRAMFQIEAKQAKRLDNVWFHHCDFVDCWAGVILEGNNSNIYFYDCLFAGIRQPSKLFSRTGRPYITGVGAGIIIGKNILNNFTRENHVVERCTFDEITTHAPTEHITQNWQKGSFLGVRSMGCQHGGVFRNLVFMNIGRSRDGTPSTILDGTRPFYTKGSNHLIENVDMDGIAGAEGFISIKGDTNGGVDPSSENITIRNVRIRNSIDVGGVTTRPGNVPTQTGIGAKLFRGTTTIENVTFENVRVRWNLIGTWSDKNSGTLVLRRLTARHCTIDGGALGGSVVAVRHAQTAAVIDDLLIEDCRFGAATTPQVIEQRSRANPTIIATDIEMRLSRPRSDVRLIGFVADTAGRVTVTGRVVSADPDETRAGEIASTVAARGAETASWLAGVGCTPRP